MLLHIERAPLANALAKLSGIIERRNTMPILGNVLLTASENTLTIKGSDLDIEATATVAANVTDPGAITVSAQMLTDIAKKAPAGALIKMELGNELTVSFGRSSFSLATLPASDFPVMATEEYETDFDITGDDMARLFGMTAFAMSTEETKYYLNGVYMHHTDHGLTAVATDGHKLARVTAGDVGEFPGVIVPRKTVAQIKGIDGDTRVSVSATKVRFASDAVTIVSKVVDGTYPNYASIIPRDYQDSLTVDASAMRAAADRVAMVSDDKVRAVKLAIGEGIIGMSSRGGMAGATDEVDAEVDGIHTVIGFNSRYLSEVLSVCDGGKVKIGYTDKGGAAVFSPASDAGFLALLMPFRVQ